MLMMQPMAMPTIFDAMLSDSIFGHPLVFRAPAPHSLSAASPRAPRVTEKDNEYTITVSAPGVSSSDVELVIEDDILKMRGETKTSTHTHFMNWSTHLPRDAAAEKATATHVDGLLQVTIPKMEKAKTVIALLAEGETTPDDTESHYTMRLNCAGIAKADLDLTIEDDLLTVTGETKSRGIRLSPRTYRLPSDADGTKTCASYVDGILTIAVEKIPIAEPKRIELTVKSSSVEEDEKGADDDAEKTEATAMDAEDKEAVMV